MTSKTCTMIVRKHWLSCLVLLVHVTMLTNAAFKKVPRADVQHVLKRPHHGFFNTEKTVHKPTKNEKICYQSITHRYVRHMVVSKGWGGACQPHHVSYESCRLLLLTTSTCNAAYYHNKVCHLLRRESKTENLLSRVTFMPDQSEHGVVLLKMDPVLDTCILPNQSYASRAQSATTAREALRMCNARSPDYNNTFNVFNSLPRLNIVVSATASWVQRNPSEFQLVRENYYTRYHRYMYALSCLCGLYLLSAICYLCELYGPALMARV